MMDQTPGTTPVRPLWYVRRKRLLVIALVIFSLVAILALAGYYYIRSGRLNRYIANQVVTALEEYGLRTEIGKFEIAWGIRTARVRDVKIYNQTTGQLIATLDRAEMVADVREPIALRLRREIVFKRLDLDHLNLRIEVDEQGRSNLDGLHPAPPKAPTRLTFDFSNLLVALQKGTLHLNDRVRQVEGSWGNLWANAQPLPGGKVIKAGLGAGAGRFLYRGREVNVDGLDLSANIEENGAQVEHMAFYSPVAQASANGRIDDWKALRYNFNLHARAALAEVGRVLDSRSGLQGEVGFDGRIEGEGAGYRVKGELNSDEFTASGARVHGAKAEGILVESKNEQINFESQQVRAQAVTMQGVSVVDVSTSAIRGDASDGRIRASAPQISVGRVDVEKGRISGITLQGLNAIMENGRYQARGSLTLKDGTISGASVGPLNGELVAGNESVALNGFKASLFGGSASGDLTVQMGRAGNSRMRADFTGLKTSDVFAVASSGRAPLAGSLDGNADLAWPGIDVLAASGSLTARLRGETTQTVDAIPVTGEVNIKARRGIFDVEQLTLNTDATRLTAGGRLSREGDSDLKFSLNSASAEQLQTIAFSIEDVRQALEKYEPQISGDLKFEGRITGRITDPAIEGDLNLASITFFDEPVGSLTGHVLVSPAEVRFENGVLTALNGGTAKFTYAAPRDEVATEGRLDATIDRIPIETLIAAAGLPGGQQFITGELSGEAHLMKLPGSPEGQVTINLVNGTIGQQAAQLATANLVFEGNTARLERAEVQLPQGRLVANGSHDLKSNIFRLQGSAENIDLGGIVGSFELANPRVTGTADATFQASGNAKDIEQLQLEITAEGKNVTINGQAAGELRLTARTSQTGRVDVDLTTGIAGKPQPLRGSIELRSPGRPVVIESDMTEFNLGSVIAAFAPDLADSIAGTVNGRLRIAGPTVNDRGEATLDGLRGSLSLTAISLQLAGRPINIETPLTVTLNGPQVALERTRVTGDGIDLSLGGTLGLREGANLNFAVNGTADLEPLGRLNTDYFFGGSATIDARLEGSVSEPRLAGEVRLNGLSFSMLDPQVNIEEGNGRILLAGDKVALENFTALANDGQVNLAGMLTLEQLKPKEWRFDLTANDVILFYQGAQLTLDSKLNLTGNQQQQLLSGAITIPQAEYATDFNLDNLTSSGGGGLDLGFEGGMGGRTFGLSPVNLNIKVEADDSLIIRNEQVNTVGTASLTIAGKLSNPDVTGRVSFEGGTIKFRSQRYDITTGTIDLPAGAGMKPLVNILTEGDVSGYHVYVGLTGPIDDMDVTLRSEPDLPRSDVLSLVTTGRTDSDTLGSEDLVRSGVGTAASLLTQEFISKPTESLLGLSRFQIDPVLRPNSNPAARLTIGRQLARNLSFTYSTNLSSDQDQTALAEYTLTNRFSALASYTQGGTSTRGGSTDSDFTIEVRGRKRFALGFLPADLAAGPNPSPASVPTRPERSPLPRAEVSLTKLEGVKLSDKRLGELLPVARDGYSRPLARLGERNLTNYLQERGYFFATVRSRCEPDDCKGPNLRVFYDVEPGQRLDLEKIRLDGTDQIGLGEVIGELQTQEGSIFGGIPILKNLPLIGGYARGITSNDRLAHDREVIRRKLVDMGYRSARVESRLAISPENDNLVVVFDVTEGPPSTIAEIAVVGNTIFSSAELREVVPIKEKEPFSLTQIRNGTQNVRKHYSDHGFLDATAELNIVDLPDDRVRLVYTVNEGSRNIATEVVITGQSKTREDSIRRFLAFKPGDTLTPELIRRTQRDLYATGAFREVNIRTEPASGDDESARRVTLGVTEAKPLLFVYGLGYSTDDGPRGLLQLTHNNLFGRINTGSIRMRASRREQLAQVTYTDLRPFGSKWSSTVSAFYNRNTHLQTFARQEIVDGEIVTQPTQSYGINRFAAFIQTERKLSEITSVRFRYNFENARLSNLENIPIEQIGRNDRSIRLGYFSVGFTRDTRDSALNPTRGQLASVEHSIAARIFGGNEAYNKFFGNYQRYRTLSPSTPLVRDSVLAFSARIGLAAPFKVTPTGRRDDKLLPISERFFAGGSTTLRGFRFEQAGPQAILEPSKLGELPALVPLGGNALTVFNFEFRYPVTRRFRLVPFYDLGNVFPLVSDISFGGMTNTVGLGLRFNTPIGPVGIDYGYLLDPPLYVTASGAVLRQSRGVIHIRLGQSF
jgi:outer membrane protein assembly complex protein YaeT